MPDTEYIAQQMDGIIQHCLSKGAVLDSRTTDSCTLTFPTVQDAIDSSIAVSDDPMVVYCLEGATITFTHLDLPY